MIIYIPEYNDKRVHTMFVQPGNDAQSSEFVDKETKRPIMFTVVFEYGKADVRDSLGQYMLDRGMAKKSPIYIPAGVEA